MMKTLKMYRKKKALEKQIRSLNLFRLKVAPLAIHGFIQECMQLKVSNIFVEKWFRELTDCYVAKTMLLVHGIDDLIEMFETITMGHIRSRLIESYAARTRDLRSIILLLNHVCKGIKSGNANEDAARVRDLLRSRGEELAAQSGRTMTPTSIKMLAEIVDDSSKDGTDSRIAEDLIISLAIPKVKHDVISATEIADAFTLQTAKHRFLLAFLEDNGLANTWQAGRIAESIRSSHFGGKDVAQKILDIADETGLDLNFRLRAKLEQLLREEKPGHGSMIGGLLGSLLHSIMDDDFDGTSLEMMGALAGMPGMPFGSIHDLMEDGEDTDSSKCLECPGLPSCPDLKAVMIRESLGMDALETGHLRQPKMTNITEGSEEEKLQQLETELRRICTEKTIDATIVNGMPAEIFMMMNLEKFSPETQGIIMTAVMSDDRIERLAD